MSLAAGTRLGSYEIIAPLGVGGMGEVYRARDTKLNRDVAIKVLLPAVANDPDRLARFSREAQVLASLNHPSIAHIYGVEEANDVTALVMELSKARIFRNASREEQFRSTKRYRSHDRSPRRSKPRTIAPSSIAISNQPTSKFAQTEQ
jgi:serine/threonine protein kinase